MARSTGGAGGTDATAAALLRALVEAYNRHAVEELLELYAPDGVHEDVAGQRRKHGPVAISAGLTRFLASVPDARWAVDRVIGSPEEAVAAYVFHGTLGGPFGDVEPRGQVIRLDAVLVVSVRGGRITRTRDYFDSATFMRQLHGPSSAPP
jgi:steroid delta-isomerase-like uncharacterized protein